LRRTTLDVMEFISRFLQHILPEGFMKVRHYGFMNANCMVSIGDLRRMIMTCLRDLSMLFSDEDRQPSERPGPFCSSCGGRLVYLFSIIPGRLCRGGPP
ncbi:MAG: transposase, partial [Desulfobacteraceae bacterium]